MQQLNVVEFLNKEPKALQVLDKKYHVRAVRHKLYKGLILLKYDQIKSPWQSKVVQECRGIIVDQDDNYKPVAMPYKKFFNMDEPHSAHKTKKLNWNAIRVYEKLDGSLCTLYWYKDQWFISSTGMPCAEGFLRQPQMTFAELFWDIWQKLNYQYPNDKTKVYMFEMYTPRHVIICKPEKEQLVLHGVRDMKTLQEEFPEPIAKQHGWECIQALPYKTQEEVLAAAQALNPAKHEGFIVVDDQFERIKVKSARYVAISLLSRDPDALMGRMNQRHMLDVVRAFESDEFMAYFPDFKLVHDMMKQKYAEFLKRAKQVYKESLHLQDNEALRIKVFQRYVELLPENEKKMLLEQKKIGKVVNQTVAAGICEALQKKVPSVEHYFATADVNDLHECIFIATKEKAPKEELPAEDNDDDDSSKKKKKASKKKK